MELNGVPLHPLVVHAVVVLGPLAALTGKHRGVCQSVESLLTEVTGASVRECCERSERPRCCFHISPKAPAKAPAGARAPRRA